MPDFADYASDAESMHRRAALSARATAPNPDAPSALECVDCGDAIPEARRIAVPGCTRCRDCQEEHDGGRP